MSVRCSSTSARQVGLLLVGAVDAGTRPEVVGDLHPSPLRGLPRLDSSRFGARGEDAAVGAHHRVAPLGRRQTRQSVDPLGDRRGYVTGARRLRSMAPVTDDACYLSVVMASGSSVPVSRMSTVRICDAGMLVAADSPVASSPDGFQEPTAVCTPSCVVTTMS